MAASTVRVKGYKELTRAARRAGSATNKEVRAALREVAEPVRAEAAAKFALIDARSAAGFRIAVRARGVAVEQRIGRVTGKRGDYGSLQMRRALIPALAANDDKIDDSMDKALDRIESIFERGAA